MKQFEDNSWTSAVLSKGGLPRVDRGEGLHIYDTQGRRYLDASGGPAVYCLGHGNTEVNEAIKRQLDSIAHGYRYSFTSDAQDELSSLIEEFCGNGLNGIVYVSGGSEAVESGLKIALQYHSARGEKSRRRFISRRRSWHGNTLGALSVSDFASRRTAFEGALIEASFVSSVNAYRPPTGVGDTDLAEHCASELEMEIERLGPQRVAGFIFEPVVGAAGGVVPAPPGYAKRVREICTKYGVLMIADEVMCGSARCGTWRALEHDGVVPDIMAIAKGLGGGYLPLGAAIYHKSVLEVLAKHDGGPLTGHTFTAHTAACAAGAAVQRIIKRDALVERVRTEGELFKQQLRDALIGVDAVGDVRGRGFFVGVEFVADRSTKEPFAAKYQLSARFNQHALARGLLCYPVSGNVDGVNGDAVILAPPYIATRAQLAEITEIVTACTIAALRDIGHG
ncbi:MAG: aspartate aminotransferase family protein [Steroidobacteraceae bacterium]|jgi:adenosylmethionine-8-amino-7-oxononanoate aminotransferase